MIKQLIKNKIHIAGIQETHIPFGGILAIGTYKLITSASIRNARYTPEASHRGTHIGGVAIAIRREMARRVSIIKSIANRLHPETLQQ